jgi:hypothetical protein
VGKVSAKGTRYFVGRLAGAKITMLSNRDKASDADADWVILLSQAEPYTGPRQAAPQHEGQHEPGNINAGDASPTPASNGRSYRHHARRTGTRSRYAIEPAPELPNDPVPF